MKRDPLLQIENVRLSFSGRGEKIDAVRGVSLSLLPGESLALVGESGCGKTALCRSILMLHSRHAEWESGRILLCGKPVTNMTEKELEQVRGRDAAMIFQDPMTSLDPALSIGRQIMEPILLHQKQSRKAAQEKAMQLMEQVEIDHPQERFYQYPHHFSGGMRQRAAIAIALAADPRLIIADEPTTALDADVQDKIMALLLRLCRGQDRGLLFVTHDLRLARKAAERTAVMKDGLIVESGRTEELFSSPQHPYTKKLVELAACKERCTAEKAGRGQEKSSFPCAAVCERKGTDPGFCRRAVQILSFEQAQAADRAAGYRSNGAQRRACRSGRRFRVRKIYTGPVYYGAVQTGER